jgi:hypothetical protein
VSANTHTGAFYVQTVCGRRQGHLLCRQDENGRVRERELGLELSVLASTLYAT